MLNSIDGDSKRSNMQRYLRSKNKEYFLGDRNMPTVRAFFTNMSVPMPLGRKLKLVFRNNFIKIWRRQNCCGHPGEPGCCEGSSAKPHSHG